jgi:hypothetical protein
MSRSIASGEPAFGRESHAHTSVLAGILAEPAARVTRTRLVGSTISTLALDGASEMAASGAVAPSDG